VCVQSVVDHARPEITISTIPNLTNDLDIFIQTFDLGRQSIVGLGHLFRRRKRSVREYDFRIDSGSASSQGSDEYGQEVRFEQDESVRWSEVDEV
jgi:hypothetical protein